MTEEPNISMNPIQDAETAPGGNIPERPVGETPLHDAARTGDLGELILLLESGANVHARDAQDRTALLVAAREGQRDAARLLLAGGAEVDARGEAMSITPLMAAARRGESPLVRLLLEAGADPNAVSKNGAGSLARTAITGDTATAEALLEAGADPSGVGSAAPPNTSPLWAAIAMKRPDLVRLLLEHGAEVNTGDSTSGTPFGIAVTGGDAGIARMLLEAGADPLRPSLSNLPLLAVALRFTNPPMAKLLEEYNLSLAREVPS